MTVSETKPLAIITGGTKGFGKGIAEKLAPRFRLALIYKSDSANAQAVLSSLKPLSTDIRIYQCDLTDSDGLEKTYHSITRDFGCDPFVLVNCAGVAHQSLSVMESLSDHKHSFAVNYFAAVQLCKLVLPSMLRQKSGRIINIISSNVSINYRGTGAYCASKVALEKFGEILGAEVCRSGITVNSIRPGWSKTEMTHDYLNSLSTESYQDLLQPSGELISPEEIGRTVEFLIDSRQINSSTITVDTGHALFRKV